MVYTKYQKQIWGLFAEHKNLKVSEKWYDLLHVTSALVDITKYELNFVSKDKLSEICRFKRQCTNVFKDTMKRKGIMTTQTMMECVQS